MSRLTALVIAVSLVAFGCGGGGGTDSAASSPTPTPSPSTQPCSRSTIETDLDALLQIVNTDTDFALYLEREDGQSYSFARGDASLQIFYESASTSKMVAAAATLWLVDTGAIDLDDTPQQWLPDWPLADDPTLAAITLANLLSFTSGLQEEALCLNLPNANFFNCVNTIAENNAGNGVIPGENFYYSSSHLQVAGAMAINAGGYEDWTALFNAFKAVTGLFPTSRFDLPSADNPRLAGGMHWTGEEYITFLRHFMNREILSSSLSDEALKDHTSTTTFTFSPAFAGLGEQWHYGFGFWHECSDTTIDCGNAGTISSPGAYGAYPFINFDENFFGVLARQGSLGTFVDGLSLYRSVQEKAEEWADCDNP